MVSTHAGPIGPGTSSSYDEASITWHPSTRRIGLNYPHVLLYTAGQPRVGERQLVRAVANTLDEAWRIRTARDVVATLPLRLGTLFNPYAHVMPGLQLDLVEGDVIPEGYVVCGRRWHASIVVAHVVPTCVVLAKWLSSGAMRALPQPCCGP